MIGFFFGLWAYLLGNITGRIDTRRAQRRTQSKILQQRRPAHEVDGMNKATLKKAFGYVRVSTLDQAEAGVSVDAQPEKIRQYCALHGLELVQIFADEGLSGKRADNRPGLQQAIAAVCKARGVLVIYSLSRLARSTRDCINIAEQLDKSGADLASITEKIDTTSSMGRFFFTIMAAMAQLVRDQIIENTKGAMDYMRGQHRRISGPIPYGFDAVADGVNEKTGKTKHKLEPNAAELLNVAGMLTAREQGASLRAIANDLNDRRVKPRSGKQWHASSVRSVLKRCATTRRT